MDNNRPPRVWLDKASTRFCTLNGLRNVENEWEIKAGKSRAEGFPDDAYFDMDPAFKKQVALADNLSNLDDMAVISPAVKAFIETLSPPKVEFLPVTIKDHKGKPVDVPYHVLNPIAVVDCIDREKSKILWNAVDPNMIAGVTKMFLHLDKIDPELMFFRVKHWVSRVLVRADVADQLMAQKFTGLTMLELEKFSG